MPIGEAITNLKHKERQNFAGATSFKTLTLGSFGGNLLDKILQRH